mmetsp:Transcript_5897/g.14970  ORF Transcript_5897/g.14970 Transcript_5897/m.14970 type:complete len:208 (-) Transcript_5897:1575-2198(-)
MRDPHLSLADGPHEGEDLSASDLKGTQGRNSAAASTARDRVLHFLDAARHQACNYGVRRSVEGSCKDIADGVQPPCPRSVDILVPARAQSARYDADEHIHERLYIMCPHTVLDVEKDQILEVVHEVFWVLCAFRYHVERGLHVVHLRVAGPLEEFGQIRHIFVEFIPEQRAQLEVRRVVLDPSPRVPDVTGNVLLEKQHHLVEGSRA